MLYLICCIESDSFMLHYLRCRIIIRFPTGIRLKRVLIWDSVHKFLSTKYFFIVGPPEYSQFIPTL